MSRVASFQSAGHTEPVCRAVAMPVCLEGADSAVCVRTEMPSHGELVIQLSAT